VEAQILSGLTIGVMLVLAAFFLLLPRIARRGLVFGVYVGEEAAGSASVLRLNSRWTRAILAWTGAAFVANAVVALRWGPLPAYVAGLLSLLCGYLVEYFRSYRAALALAPLASPPPAVAYVASSPRPLPAYVSLVACALGGLLAIVYTWLHLDQLPAQMPVHFDAVGRPDAYRPTSFGSIWGLPLLTMVVGTALSGMAALIAHAKRAVRRGDEGRSLAAQERFRAAMSAFLAVTALVTTGLMVVTSIGAVRVATGAARTLPPLVPVISILLVGLAVGGTGFLAVRYGQGGARIEAPGGAPLTNGLADNRRWALGLFYFNPQDPSIFVEKRFGFGYTLNFGNWKAVVALVLFLALLLLGPLFLQ
jgi:uncharacterized membrane protein